LRLSNLCWIYDNNHITIEGSTRLTFSENVAERFHAYGWNVLRVEDANDLDRLSRAFNTFKSTSDKPTLIKPLFLGVIVGAITEGRLPASTEGSFVTVFIRPWLTPFSIAVGAFALALFGYVAAVYLTLEAHDADEQAAFRVRALISGLTVFVLAATVLLFAVPDVRSALLASVWALPLHVATGASALAAFAFLWLERYHLARLAAASQVVFILWGWALTQYPYAIRPHLTLVDAAAPANVQILLLQVLGVGAVVLLPSLLYLFGIFGPRGHQSRSE
jgi:cytochrome d ubiquinol oxidase subunit II